MLVTEQKIHEMRNFVSQLNLMKNNVATVET